MTTSEDLALAFVLGVVIGMLLISLWITADWLIEIFRSQNHDR